MAPSWLPSRSLLPRADSLTASQGLALDSIERVVSMMSLLGCIALITSFLTIKNLRTRSFNRLLFLAACGNILSNVATFIGHTGIKGGDRSGLCKFQATLIQWSVFALHDKGCIDRDQVHACRWTLGLLHGSQCLPYVPHYQDRPGHSPLREVVLCALLRRLRDPSLDVPAARHRWRQRLLRRRSGM
jgi:hypothetical protein